MSSFKYQLKKDTKANWELRNPVLDIAEPGFSIDESVLKIGNGIDHWQDLPSIGAGGGGGMTLLVSNSDANSFISETTNEPPGFYMSVPDHEIPKGYRIIYKLKTAEASYTYNSGVGTYGLVFSANEAVNIAATSAYNDGSWWSTSSSGMELTAASPNLFKHGNGVYPDRTEQFDTLIAVFDLVPYQDASTGTWRYFFTYNMLSSLSSDKYWTKVTVMGNGDIAADSISQKLTLLSVIQDFTNTQGNYTHVPNQTFSCELYAIN